METGEKNLSVLLAEVLGGGDKVGQGRLGLGPLTGLETTVGVDPELVGGEELQHLFDAADHLLLAGNTGTVDIPDTRTDVRGELGVNEDLEELGIGLAVLDGQHIGVQGSNGVEEVLELRVTEVGVDLSAVGDASSGQTERLDSPLDVLLTLGTGAERETLTESRLVDLDDLDTSGLEINDLIAQSESKLLSLDRLVDIVTGERPPQTGDGTSQHALHGLLRDRDGVLGLLDGHRSGTRDVTDDDRGTHAARAVRLDPSLLSEDVTSKTLAEVLDHVVTLGLTVHEDIKIELLLNLDNFGDLGFDELLVLLSSDFALGELVTGDTDVRRLGERANGGGRELGQLDVLGLLRNASGEG